MRLSQYVTVVLGRNPSPYTLNGTNTYLIGQGRKKILIDTGEGVDGYIDDLAKEVDEIHCILITHHHKDHTGGLNDVLARFGQVPVYKFLRENEGRPYQNINEGDVINFEDLTIEVIRTPGHCDDHICFWFPQEKAIFTGDIILGTGSTLLSNYTDYLRSMQKLKRFNADFLYTAHGEAKVPALKIDADLEHRKVRERQIIQFLDGKMSPQEIMRKVYGDIDQRLIAPALGNTILYLNHLKELGVLTESEGNWYKL